jgi:hypothetical protein
MNLKILDLFQNLTGVKTVKRTGLSIYYWPPVCVQTCTGREEEEKIEFIKIKQKEEENKKRQEEIKKIEQIYNSLDPLQQEEIRIETKNRLPDFWKVQLNKERIKGKTSKVLEVVLEEKRREIIKEWINSGRIKDINSK